MYTYLCICLYVHMLAKNIYNIYGMKTYDELKTNDTLKNAIRINNIYIVCDINYINFSPVLKIRIFTAHQIFKNIYFCPYLSASFRISQLYPRNGRGTSYIALTMTRAWVASIYMYEIKSFKLLYFSENLTLY